MKNPFGFLFASTNLAERAVDNAEYWMRECHKVEAERDQWRARYFDARGHHSSIRETR